MFLLPRMMMMKKKESNYDRLAAEQNDVPAEGSRRGADKGENHADVIYFRRGEGKQRILRRTIYP